jgi:long-chain acyl-CoA synthetase
VFEELAKMIPGADVINVGSAKHKVQLERHQAVNRAIERFTENRHGSWRDHTAGRDPKTERPWLAHYGPDVPRTVPIPRQPLPKFLESAADWAPKRPALIFYGSRLNYRQLDWLVNQFAHVLHGLGVHPGDRVMIVLPNIPQMVVAYYAALKIGGVVVLSNPEADAAQVVSQIEQTRPKVLVTLQDFDGLINAVRQHTPLQTIIVADIREAVSAATYKKLLARWGVINSRDHSRPRPAPEGCLPMAQIMADASREPPAIRVSPNALAAIIYTSGTTEDPKGVCLTHANLVANTLQTRHWIHQLKYGCEICLSVVPLTHSYGMTNALNIPIALAATLVLLPVFELEPVLQHIKTHKPTLFPGVPAMYTAINQADDARAYGLDSIKACISGATPLPVEVQEAFEKITRGRLVEGYGLTEASPVTHANPLYGLRKVGSIGLPIPNTDAKIIDLATGADLPPGHIGELVVKGPQVMQGYWADPPGTAAVLQNGWLYTGDVAVMDSDGYFQIISRKRDTIMAGAYSVYPRDVEEVLYENSKVLEAAVVGIPAVENDHPTARVKAFVVPRPGTSLSKEELLALCRRRLDAYAVPWDIEFRTELPKSFVGKVLRRMLLEE